MDGRNASGRRVSLLNENDLTSPLPSPRFSAHSRSSSYTSQSSRGNPFSHYSLPYHISSDLPTFERLNSASSHSTLEPESPSTPEYTKESPISFRKSPVSQSFEYMRGEVSPSLGNRFEPVFQKDGMGYHQQQMDDRGIAMPAMAQIGRTYNRSSRHALSIKTVSAGTTSSKLTNKKNQYPCPFKDRVKCSDTFTTSGHAARHGKKHTGEKNIKCLECPKRFTRKDNMKQHLKTHYSGRAASAQSKNNTDRRSKKEQFREHELGTGDTQFPLPKLELQSLRENADIICKESESPQSPTHFNDLLNQRNSQSHHIISRYDPQLRVDTRHTYGAQASINKTALVSPSGGLDALATAASRLHLPNN
ncbi:MAG: hypothetical protein M1827_006494 [Pycnora praestabilis]|nr:MAG: hypothetical protein M1827_006494 [Pycnora praestabilis]